MQLYIFVNIYQPIRRDKPEASILPGMLLVVLCRMNLRYNLYFHSSVSWSQQFGFTGRLWV